MYEENILCPGCHAESLTPILSRTSHAGYYPGNSFLTMDEKWACRNCGDVVEFPIYIVKHECPICDGEGWVVAGIECGFCEGEGYLIEHDEGSE